METTSEKIRPNFIVSNTAGGITIEYKSDKKKPHREFIPEITPRGWLAIGAFGMTMDSVHVKIQPLPDEKLVILTKFHQGRLYIKPQNQDGTPFNITAKWQARFIVNFKK